MGRLLRMTGRVGAARGDDPAVVEDHLRRGILAMDEFGSVGERACAQVELARWLARLDAFAVAPVTAST